MEHRNKKEELNQLFITRRDIWKIADLGYLCPTSEMAASLQPNALRLNRRLTDRMTRDDLILEGILPND